REHVAHVSGGLVTITGQEFFFFTHSGFGNLFKELSFKSSMVCTKSYPQRYKKLCKPLTWLG
ncbi:hypothetical protein, partial [uncultured Duncaniella sp.]|uniref:hypothetical protein n=1 Tax=uncultured Duncaniella sp. TaxID=2768039 RepID=UPI00262B4C72